MMKRCQGRTWGGPRTTLRERRGTSLCASLGTGPRWWWTGGRGGAGPSTSPKREPARCWAGDNQPNFGSENGLPSVIVAGLSAAMSGFSIWGHDIGGYENANFSPISPADLFIRWTQFGCFAPIMQIHRQVNTANLRQYPWGYAQAG